MSGNDNNEVAGAIAYPGRSQDTPEMQPLPVQPRPARNLQGLLRFAMEATRSEDAPGHSAIGPMDEERKRFLEEAMKRMTLNMAEVLSTSIKLLSDAERIHSIQLCDTLPDDVHAAFNNLMEMVDELDIANDFYRVGGFSVFPVCYGCENDQVRQLANSLLAEVCQNNPYCQAKALESGLLNLLLNMVHTERKMAMFKCLSAISCLCRGYEPACRELIAQDGCRTLSQLLLVDDVMVKTKLSFIIRCLCDSYPEAREQFLKLKVIQAAGDLLSDIRDDASEHFLSIILSLIEDGNPVAIAQCREPVLKLQSVLEKHLTHPDLTEEAFREEKEYCEEILNRVFKNYSPVEVVEEVADR